MTYNEFGEAPVEFDELADCLVEQGGGNHPSELHGFLCGMLAGGQQPGVQKWKQQISEMLGDAPLTSRSEEVLSRMYMLSLKALEESDFSITLLLPEDDETLGQRTEALGYWCQGFLSGFGEAAAGKNMSDEIEGVINDFSEIVRIQPEADESDEAERFYMEVSEFVRMALITVFAEFSAYETEAQTEGAGKAEQNRSFH